MSCYFIGVDVGTSSVRAGLYDQNGNLVKYCTQQIEIFNFKTDFYEQSSENIWQAVCICVQNLIKSENINVENILSIGFDATCSLVVVDSNKAPLSVSCSKRDDINVIMWMDHRSTEQANYINSTNNNCLKSVGGKISPEMDPPKILWLKQNMYEECYKKAGYFFSLPDYLFFKSTGRDIRSICCVTCKWLYQANENKQEWSQEFWKSIGLSDLVEDDFNKIGSFIGEPFKYVENTNICELASKQLGLSIETRVGISMIDAHSGGVGAIAVAVGALKSNILSDIRLSSTIERDEMLVIVSGTSSCHMASNKSAQFIDGVWGPYYKSMLPDMWLNEAGQSSSGKLIDFIIQNHPAYNQLKEVSHTNGIYETLNGLVKKLARKNNLNDQTLSKLARNIHVYPDFHGNRSPLADPNLKGAIVGLNFDNNLDNLTLLYLACMQSLAYQTKHIINHMKSKSNYEFKLIVIIGGLAKNQIYTSLHSDICSLPVVIPNESDSAVLLGSCISGACNTDLLRQTAFDDVLKQFSGASNINKCNISAIFPNTDDELKQFHIQKYNVYLEMMKDQYKYIELMK